MPDLVARLEQLPQYTLEDRAGVPSLLVVSGTTLALNAADGLSYLRVDQVLALCRAWQAEQGKEPHRCSGCGLTWEGDLKGAELCGDCWRNGQRVIHGVEEQGWQPIRTAPKDGMTWILVTGCNASPLVLVAGYQPDSGRWVSYGYVHISNPTHWMPLPAAPTPTEELAPT